MTTFVRDAHAWRQDQRLVLMLTDRFYFAELYRKADKERFVVIARNPIHLFRVTSALVESGVARHIYTSTSSVPLQEIREIEGSVLVNRGWVVIPNLAGTLRSAFQIPLETRSYVYLLNGTWDAAL
uniref:Uncharacterized protein n=1 Tax=Leviviridae sp. TaxID=2027243 RepID=A0A514D1V1_9VIRU|nr:MAG: hypothetical protein H3RhizoL146347e1371_000002 [Leviviridae sp.]